MLKILQKRQFKLLLACISLLLLLNMIQETYAKYVSSADASSNFTIARWAFLVNQQDVLANSNFSNTIVPVFDQNENIAGGVIAPTSTGYFDIVIDSSNVGVSFDETITLSKPASDTVTDLVFTGYKKNNDEVTTLNNLSTATITTTHLLNSGSTVNTYRIYFMWNDDSQTETMNNAADTAASVDGSTTINVNLSFVQRASSN